MKTKDALEKLKTAVCKLNPTGHDGFEGLLAVILGQISGHTFRLAGSGSQHGKDGDASSDTSHISFECKLYTNDLVKDNILSKSVEVLNVEQPPDVWVLCATAECKTQIRDPLKLQFEKAGVTPLLSHKF